jgi:type I restriction enzyme S subunit
VKKLGEISEISSGGTPSRQNTSYYNGNINWVKTTEVNGNIILSTEEKITDAGLKNSSCKIYPKDSIIVAMYGQGKTRGQVGLLGISAATNQACGVIKASDKFNSLYVYNYLKSSYKQLRDLGRGGNQENLNSGILKNFPIIYPPISLQNQFATQIQNIEQQKERLKIQIQASEQLFQALLKKAFNGGLN